MMGNESQVVIARMIKNRQRFIDMTKKLKILFDNENKTLDLEWDGKTKEIPQEKMKFEDVKHVRNDLEICMLHFWEQFKLLEDEVLALQKIYKIKM